MTKKVMLGACGGGCCASLSAALRVRRVMGPMIAKHFVMDISITSLSRNGCRNAPVKTRFKVALPYHPKKKHRLPINMR